MKLLQLVAPMLLLLASAKASDNDRPYSYILNAIVVSYQVPKELSAAHTRIRERFESNEDRVIYTTAFRVRTFFTEKTAGNFTMGVIALPEELRDVTSLRKIGEYYKTKFQNEQENVAVSTYYIGQREWLRIETSLKKSPGSCSGIWFYRPISNEYLIGVALVTAQGDSWPEHLLKKLLPSVEKVTASIKCTGGSSATQSNR